MGKSVIWNQTQEHMLTIPATLEAETRRSQVVESHPRQPEALSQNIIKRKIGQGYSLVIEDLPSMYKALG